ncbi:MAG: hypothetical protein IT233_08940 [Bacteroidia bacterium]|nr:hypothetical protein [Bacteroidia bacterium]
MSQENTRKPKEKSTAVFDLIKSLTGSEKRYFKIFAQRHVIGSENNYLRLFDAIEAQDIYDEDDLLEKFRKEKFAKQLHRIKNYLYDLVMKSLCEFHKAKSISSEVRQKLEMIEILYAKGLISHAHKLLQTTFELADVYEQYQYVPELRDLERKILNSQFYAGKSEADLEKMHAAYRESLDVLTEINNNWLRAMRLMLFLNAQGPARSKEELRTIESAFEENKPELCNVKSFEACNYYYFNYGMYYRLAGNEAKAYEYALKHLRWYEEHSFFIRERLRSYLSLLYNFLGISLSLNRLDGVFGEVMQKLEQLPVEYAGSPQNNNFLQQMHFNAINTIKLSYIIATGKIEEGLLLIPRIAEEMKNLQEKTEPIIEYNFYFSFARIYFTAGNFPKANENLNRIINSGKVQRTDIYCFSKIMSLLIHYEMGKMDLLEYSVVSTYRYLLKRNRLYKVENHILDFIRKKAPHMDSEKKKLDAFSELKDQLICTTKDDAFEKRALEYFDLISWLESKISGRRFQDIIAEKIRQPEYRPNILNDFVNV